MSRFPVRRCLILVPAVLAACAGVSADWVKPGASEKRVEADNAACRAEAEDVYGRTADITHDIEVSRPRSLTDVDRRSDQIRSYDTERNYDKVFGACMAARGYQRRAAGNG